MASFGETLRREREMRGVTLKEISATTKISTRFLEALEAEDFSKIPGGIFTRSFIQAYAGYLGLDEERIMAEYQLVAPKGEADFSRIGTAHSSRSGRGSRTPILLLLAAAVMLGSGYALFHYSHRADEMQLNTATPATVSSAPSPPTSASQEYPAHASSEGSPPGAAPPSTAPATESSSTQSGRSEALPGLEKSPPGQPTSRGTKSTEVAGLHSGNESASVAQKPFARQSTGAVPGSSTLPPSKGSPGEGRLVLQVAATERAWVAVEADGKTIMQGILNPNEVKTLKAKDSFDVNTGNAQGIILTLNGETLKPLGRRGEVKSMHLTRADLKNPAP